MKATKQLLKKPEDDNEDAEEEVLEDDEEVEPAPIMKRPAARPKPKAKAKVEPTPPKAKVDGADSEGVRQRKPPIKAPVLETGPTERVVSSAKPEPSEASEVPPGSPENQTLPTTVDDNTAPLKRLRTGGIDSQWSPEVFQFMFWVYTLPSFSFNLLAPNQYYALCIFFGKMSINMFQPPLVYINGLSLLGCLII